MLAIVMAIGLFIMAVCLYGFVSPSGLVRFVDLVFAGPGLWIGFSLRIVLAVALFLGASESLTPMAWKILAGVALAAGLALPLVGEERVKSLIEWWSRRPAWSLRAWSMVSALFGAYLVWSASPLLGSG